MTIEDRLKNHIGELTVTILDLQTRLEEANRKIKELEEKSTTREGGTETSS